MAARTAGDDNLQVDIPATSVINQSVSDFMKDVFVCGDVFITCRLS